MVIATYIASSNWELDFELTKDMDWYIRWDTLYVKHPNDSDYTEYEPDTDAESSLSQTLKRPTWVYFDDDLVLGQSSFQKLQKIMSNLFFLRKFNIFKNF